MRVGFIGTGNIGRPMASQIAAAGFPLVVHDRRREAAAPLLDVRTHYGPRLRAPSQCRAT